VLLAYERAHLSLQFAEFNKKVEEGASKKLDSVSNANYSTSMEEEILDKGLSTKIAGDVKFSDRVSRLRCFELICEESDEEEIDDQNGDELNQVLDAAQAAAPPAYVKERSSVLQTQFPSITEMQEEDAPSPALPRGPRHAPMTASHAKFQRQRCSGRAATVGGSIRRSTPRGPFPADLSLIEAQGLRTAFA